MQRMIPELTFEGLVVYHLDFPMPFYLLNVVCCFVVIQFNSMHSNAGIVFPIEVVIHSCKIVYIQILKNVKQNV